MTDKQTSTDLSAWFKDRPKWLQEAAGLLVTKGRLAKEYLNALLDRCLRQIRSEDTTAAASFPVDTFQAQSLLPLRLSGIGDVICVACNPRTLHPNVFAGDGVAQSADITYSSDHQERQASWSTSQGVNADHRSVDIFDAECPCDEHTPPNEVSVSPPTPDELKTDLDALRDWRVAFVGRTTT